LKELVTKELFILKRYQVDPKEIKCLLQCCGKHEAMFPIVGYLARQILSIVRSQINIKRFFSLRGILTNLRRCCSQPYNLEKMIFIYKNWSIYHRDGCKPPFILELIEKDLDFEKS
jgi:hypothetical protein